MQVKIQFQTAVFIIQVLRIIIHHISGTQCGAAQEGVETKKDLL